MARTGAATGRVMGVHAPSVRLTPLGAALLALAAALPGGAAVGLAAWLL